jgi:hypothetical protein
MRPETKKLLRRILPVPLGMATGYCIVHWCVFRDYRHPWDLFIMVATSAFINLYVHSGYVGQSKGMTTLNLGGARDKSAISVQGSSD